ncbi:hypothetical protein HpHUE40_13050 [Helicobacter pylori]|nr:hypothetical protein CHC155_01250 [Helicobacter pylori]GHQ45091.1 hypothetical protein VN0361_09390 [Helicobacter pylori]GHS24653.1 hypothetical protein VN1289_11820 [Helicobacter pylori]
MFCNHFFPKTQGFACKSGVILEFWLHAVKLSLAWHEDACSFKQALKRFLKLNQRSVKQSLIPYIDLSWARDPSLRVFDML